MVDKAEKIKQFIRDLRSCDYYCRVIMDFNLKLEDVAYRLQGVGSPHVKDVIYENSSDPYSNAAKLELMGIETELTRERQVYIDRIKHCEKIEAINTLLRCNMIRFQKNIIIRDRQCLIKQKRQFLKLFNFRTFSVKKCVIMIVWFRGILPRNP